MLQTRRKAFRRARVSSPGHRSLFSHIHSPRTWQQCASGLGYECCLESFIHWFASNEGIHCRHNEQACSPALASQAGFFLMPQISLLITTANKLRILSPRHVSASHLTTAIASLFVFTSQPMTQSAFLHLPLSLVIGSPH